MTAVHDGGIGDLLQGLFEQQAGVKRLLEQVLNQAMEGEASEHLGAERHERTSDRRGHRNGTKPRSLKTRVGELALEVPQVRGCEPYRPSMFARYQRSERALLVACAEMYFQGVSTRRVRTVLEELCGTELSAMTVSRAAAELDEQLQRFRSRGLGATPYSYLIIDARYEHVRVDGHVVGQAVLVATGVNGAGGREVLDWRVGNSESEATWGELFSDLKARGLRGVKLVVSDAHQGIVAAVKRHFQGVAWQRCRVHFKRELGKQVSHKAYRELMRDIRAVFAGSDRSQCLALGEQMAQRWERRSPKVARMLREGLEDCLAVLHFPPTHRRRLTSTNMLERVMRELKRRSRVVGVFPNAASCDRLMGALLVEMDERWRTEPIPYFNMKLLVGEQAEV